MRGVGSRGHVGHLNDDQERTHATSTTAIVCNHYPSPSVGYSTNRYQAQRDEHLNLNVGDNEESLWQYPRTKDNVRQHNVR